MKNNNTENNLIDKARQLNYEQRTKNQQKNNLKGLYKSLFSLFCLAGSLSALTGGIITGIQSENNPNKVKKATVLNAIGLGSLSLGMPIGCYLGNTHPFQFIRYLKNLKWNKNGGQTVSQKVFDSLVFKQTGESKDIRTKYSSIQKDELERLTQRIDLSDLDQNKQIQLLQMIIDTCEEFPSMANLLRKDIFPLRIKQESIYTALCEACAYSVKDETNDIRGTLNLLNDPFNFMHEFAHATQDRAGFFTPMNEIDLVDPNDNLYAINLLLAETNARSISYLFFKDMEPSPF